MVESLSAGRHFSSTLSFQQKMAGANDGSADGGIMEDENEARECFAMFDEDRDGFIKRLSCQYY